MVARASRRKAGACSCVARRYCWMSRTDLEMKPRNSSCARLPHRLARALRPLPVIRLAADGVVAHRSKNLSGLRQGLGVDPLVGIPQFRAHDRARALEVDFL